VVSLLASFDRLSPRASGRVAVRGLVASLCGGMVLDGDLTCVECGSSRVWLDYDGGEVVCMACGIVLPEYRVEVMNRECYEVSYDPDGIREILTRLRGTMVGWGVYGPGMMDGKGRRLNIAEFETAMRHVQFEGRDLAGSCLIQMVRIVEGTIARLHLPKIVRARAVEIYRKANGAGIRRPLRLISSAAIYIACRENQIPIQMRQIVHPADRRLVWRMHNRIRFALDLKPPPPRRFPRGASNGRGSKLVEDRLSKQWDRDSRIHDLASRDFTDDSRQFSCSNRNAGSSRTFEKMRLGRSQYGRQPPPWT
jgi:hypothetical protein